DAALHPGERPPHRAQAGRCARRAGRRDRLLHRRVAQEGEPVVIPAHVFREYDIRGLHATELTDEAATAVGRAFGTLIAEQGGLAVALGRDVRPSSARLERAVEQGIVSTGLEVQKTGVVPTPALYYAVASRRLDGGLQVTGSHNPPEFNGFKMTRAKLPLFGAEIQEMRERIAAGRPPRRPGGGGAHPPGLPRPPADAAGAPPSAPARAPGA